MKYNSLRGSPTYFYSFEYEGANTVFSLLFSGSTPPLPHGKTQKKTFITIKLLLNSHFLCTGVTHGDDLIYLFSTGLFLNFPDEDKRIRRQMVDLWTNFVIHG